MLVAVLLLAACGSEETQTEGPADQPVPKETQDVVNVSDEKNNLTDDPMMIATNDDYEYFFGNTDEFKVTRYLSDDTDEDGFIEIDENGYNIKFNVLYGESEFGDDKILIVGEHKNNNNDGGKMIWYPGDIVLDGEEKTESGYGFDAVDPGIKSKFTFEYDVEYGIPDKIVIEGGRIEESDEDKYLDQQADPIELDKTFTFTKK